MIKEIKLEPLVIYGLQKGTMIPVAQVTYTNPEERISIIEGIFLSLSEASQEDTWAVFGPTMIFPNAYDAFKVM